MFCYNCGNKIDGYSVCPYCGAPVYEENNIDYQNNATQQYDENYFDESYNNIEYTNNYNDSYSYDNYYNDNSTYNGYMNDKDNNPHNNNVTFDNQYMMTPTKNGNVLFYTIASLMSIAIIAMLVFVIIISIDNSKTKNDISTSSIQEKKLSLILNNYNSDASNNNSETIGGFVSTDNSAAYLVINGTTVKNFKENVENESWSYDVSLESGKNQFIITLYDDNGSSESEKITINRSENLTFPKGTLFVKNVNDGVYIRNTPQISKEYLMLIPKEDTTSTFECVGEESVDSDGYTWCKIKTEDGMVGWVRSDLMKTI